LLQVTDGNLASHIKALEKEDYVEVSESNLLARKPNTTYLATKGGKLAFKKHINALEALISNQNT
jgi:DNA-binding MarR family transcriptional regulator